MSNGAMSISVMSTKLSSDNNVNFFFRGLVLVSPWGWVQGGGSGVVEFNNPCPSAVY